MIFLVLDFLLLLVAHACKKRNRSSISRTTDKHVSKDVNMSTIYIHDHQGDTYIHYVNCQLSLSLLHNIISSLGTLPICQSMILTCQLQITHVGYHSNQNPKPNKQRRRYEFKIFANYDFFVFKECFFLQKFGLLKFFSQKKSESGLIPKGPSPLKSTFKVIRNVLCQSYSGLNF